MACYLLNKYMNVITYNMEWRTKLGVVCEEQGTARLKKIFFYHIYK